MKSGHFYFISDNYFTTHDPNRNLMQNKAQKGGQPHNRPCFLAFSDKKNPQIFWCIPISSQLNKYKNIVASKLAKQQRQKSVKYPVCDTIRFGKVMGIEKAFLIQNMFPVTNKYIASTYIDNNTNNEVTLDPQTEADVIKHAKKVLKLSFRGVPLILADVQKMYVALEAELEADRISQKQPKKVFSMPRNSMIQKAQQLHRDTTQHEAPSKTKEKAAEQHNQDAPE